MAGAARRDASTHVAARYGVSALSIILVLIASLALPRGAEAARDRRPLLADSGGEPADASFGTELVPVKVAGPFEAPWSIAFLPDGSLLVTERPGRLQRVVPGAATEAIAGVPEVLYAGHGGLMDVVLDRRFAENGIVYLSYLHGSETGSRMRVASARLDLAGRRLTGLEVIFESTAAANSEMLGGRIALSSDGHLFLTVGDRWEPDLAQDLSDHAGTIVRIRTDGSVPHDNPFVAHPGARPEIWSYGHRNPQGLAFNSATGELWSIEHGPKGGDELNLIRPGRNYGWPVITYGRSYSDEPIGEGTAKEGMEQPVRYWVPSIAPSGLVIEATEADSVLWFGALIGQSVFRLEMAAGSVQHSERLLHNRLGRIRDIRLSPEGVPFVLTDGGEAELYRLEIAVDQVQGRRHNRRL